MTPALLDFEDQKCQVVWVATSKLTLEVSIEHVRFIFADESVPEARLEMLPPLKQPAG